MGTIIDRIKEMIGGEKRSMKTLARRSGMEKVSAKLMRQTDWLTRQDVQAWRMAWQMALSVENPQRGRLYDIYRDAMVDGHLSGCIEQRKGLVMSKSFCLKAADGTQDEEALAYLEKEWFKRLMGYVLDATYWGHSLIELGNVVSDGQGRLSFDGVRLIPREHVVPEYGRVVITENDPWQQGIDYRDPVYSEWLIEAGDGRDLGLLLKAAPHTIAKKNALAYWDTFAEIFGMPMRIAHTNVRDEKELRKTEQMMEDMGTAFWGLFAEGTDIEIKESTKGDAFNVYDRRVDRANSEISKIVLGQTMTIEDGSSLSQSQTHLKVLENMVEADARMLRDVVNNQLLPRMARRGFGVDGLTFEWNESVDYTPEQQLAIEQLVVGNYEVGGEYFEEKYGIPAGERRNGGMGLAADGEGWRRLNRRGTDGEAGCPGRAGCPGGTGVAGMAGGGSPTAEPWGTVAMKDGKDGETGEVSQKRLAVEGGRDFFD